MKWYFQTVRHELWDYNLPPAPGLIDIVQGWEEDSGARAGGQIRLHVHSGSRDRQARIRRGGAPVAKSNVPGEVSYPTQPIPVKPPPISRVSFTRDDIVTAADTTPEHAQGLPGSVGQLRRPVQRRPVHCVPVSRRGATTQPAIIFPGTTGGANWGGTATDPKLGYIFVNTKDSPLMGWMEANPKYTPGNPDGIEPYIHSSPQGLGGFNAQSSGTRTAA